MERRFVCFFTAGDGPILLFEDVGTVIDGWEVIGGCKEFVALIVLG